MGWETGNLLPVVPDLKKRPWISRLPPFPVRCLLQNPMESLCRIAEPRGLPLAQTRNAISGSLDLRLQVMFGNFVLNHILLMRTKIFQKGIRFACSSGDSISY